MPELPGFNPAAKPPINPFEGMSPESDVVLTSRVRLARNHAGMPFPGLLDPEKAQDSIRRAAEALSPHGLTLMRMDSLSVLQRQTLVERWLISRDLLKSPDRSAVLVSEFDSWDIKSGHGELPSKMLSVMVNEEDHLRVQAFVNEFNLDEAARIAFEADQWIIEKIDVAYDEEFGYLTACPTNTGTGMRASVMLHMPALTWAGEMGKVTQAVSKLGLTLRGLYGEGTEAQGDLYQLSNQVTLGRTEGEILDDMRSAASQMMDWERKVRVALHAGDRIALEDRLMRALGVMERARKISAKEFMQRWSCLRLGACMKLIPLRLSALDRLLTAAQPASLQQSAGETLSDEQRDVRRASMIQSAMKE
ncbi:MAG: protein arginine kinase [Oscillospiraceae bacterium]|jgi:protein arginine kinase|nr:protein arginine kinase [Oscillospiraceae bacterium]